MAVIAAAQSFVNDPTFNVVDPGNGNGLGPSWELTAVVQQSDGKILIAGPFVSYDGILKNRLARLNSDGSLDPTFDVGSGTVSAYSVYGVKLQPNDQAIVYGDFDSFSGAMGQGILRLNTNGSVDTTFHSGITSSANIYDAVIQPDGRILIGGDFTSYDGVSRNRIARLNYDGSLDTTFQPPTTASFLYVPALGLRSDGKVMVCYRATYWTWPVRRLNADGTLDASFTYGNADNFVADLVISPDDEVIVIGSFDEYSGVPCEGIIRLLSDGIVDTTFEESSLLQGACNSAPTTSYSSIALQPDGKIILGGAFGSLGGTIRHNVLRLHDDGSLDSSFDPDMTTGIHGRISSIDIQADGKILLGGVFRANRWHLTRLEVDGSFDPSFDPGTTGFNYGPNCAVIQPDGKTIIGGRFTSFNNSARNGIARLDLDGSLDASFDPGTGVDKYVQTLAIQPDGKILVGGDFCTYNDQYSGGDIFRVHPNGALDTSFQYQSGIGYGVNAIEVQPDGRIIYSGYNLGYGSYPNWITRVFPNGTLDASFQPDTGLVYTVWCSALQPDGKVIIGGGFFRINGHERWNIARLNQDGSLDTTFNPGWGANGMVTNIVLDDFGRILIGGNFTSVDSVAHGHIARLLPDGSLDPTFATGSGADDYVRAIAIQPDGGILVGGSFDSFDGVAAANIVRLLPNGSLDANTSFGSGSDGTVSFLAIQPDEKIIVGGSFISFDGIGRNHITRIVKSITTGRPDHVVHNSTAFPNPSTGRFTISSDLAAPMEIIVTDITGHEIFRDWHDQGGPTFDLTGQPTGFYVATLRTRTGTASFRLSIQ